MARICHRDAKSVRNEKMTNSASSMTEKQLDLRAEELLQTIGLTLVDKQVRLGAYRFDAVALDRKNKKIVVVELKTERYKGALGQILLYRSALKRHLAMEHPANTYDVDALLITTFLDLEVVDVLQELDLGDAVRVKVCVGAGTSFSLVDPADAPETETGYQSLRKLSPRFAERVKAWNLE